MEPDERPARASLLRYWAKTGPKATEAGVSSSYHPLGYHCLDVAACGQALLAANLFFSETRLLKRLIPTIEEVLAAGGLEAPTTAAAAQPRFSRCGASRQMSCTGERK